MSQFLIVAHGATVPGTFTVPEEVSIVSPRRLCETAETQFIYKLFEIIANQPGSNIWEQHPDLLNFLTVWESESEMNNTVLNFVSGGTGHRMGVFKPRDDVQQWPLIDKNIGRLGNKQFDSLFVEAFTNFPSPNDLVDTSQTYSLDLIVDNLLKNYPTPIRIFLFSCRGPGLDVDIDVAEAINSQDSILGRLFSDHGISVQHILTKNGGRLRFTKNGSTIVKIEYSFMITSDGKRDTRHVLITKYDTNFPGYRRIFRTLSITEDSFNIKIVEYLLYEIFIEDMFIVRLFLPLNLKQSNGKMMPQADLSLESRSIRKFLQKNSSDPLFYISLGSQFTPYIDTNLYSDREQCFPREAVSLNEMITTCGQNIECRGVSESPTQICYKGYGVQYNDPNNIWYEKRYS